ncbi:flagellar protein FlgN [Pistricoccus aurantiacus]|uniref:Flagellar protein FlgN n=1 Tax=Pistricoccus aurantiacus TaxID=1883414 RepID=A0A5B8SRE3_9GAMM|nr:flagellar protein FlgN [Pistricoccus aurantiacus]QEA39682.1 flagellar protein FlgN [Pistricoccus aurantiacus]
MSLQQQLERQQAALDALVELLHRERQALTQGRVDGELLQCLADAKQIHFVELEALEAKRRQEQQALGYGVDHSGAQQAAWDMGLLDQWRALQESAELVRGLNERNGGLILDRMTHNQRMLNALHELRGDSLYNPAGQARKASGHLAYRA